MTCILSFVFVDRFGYPKRMHSLNLRMFLRCISLKHYSQFRITFQKSLTCEHLRKSAQCHQAHCSVHIFQNLLFLYYITTCCLVLLCAGIKNVILIQTTFIFTTELSVFPSSDKWCLSHWAFKKGDQHMDTSRKVKEIRRKEKQTKWKGHVVIWYEWIMKAVRWHSDH